MAELRENTKNISDYIRAQGYHLIEMYECQWESMKRYNPSVTSFVKKHFDNWTNRHLGSVSQEEILSAVKIGDLFGFVRCDIHVPDDKKHIWSEMPPIFKHVEVSRDDIGDFMRDYGIQHDIMAKPRKMLIGSMFGENILLATPLLKFYLENELVVTKVYETIEYEAKACFKAIGERVCNARRAGDADADKAVIAEMEKLMG